VDFCRYVCRRRAALIWFCLPVWTTPTSRFPRLGSHNPNDASVDDGVGRRLEFLSPLSGPLYLSACPVVGAIASRVVCKRL
jgi:hypothetical protein